MIRSLMSVAVCVGMLVVSTASAEVTFPWQTYGEATVMDGVEKGVKLDGWFEQGIETGLGSGKWKINTFVQPHLTLSNNQDQWWNNKASVYVGVKLLRDIDLGSKADWGKLSFGVRGEFNRSLDGKSGADGRDEMRAVGFVQWSIGGNWSKKK